MTVHSNAIIVHICQSLLILTDRNLVERFLLLTDMDETFQRSFAPNPNRSVMEN